MCSSLIRITWSGVSSVRTDCVCSPEVSAEGHCEADTALLDIVELVAGFLLYTLFWFYDLSSDCPLSRATASSAVLSGSFSASALPSHCQPFGSSSPPDDADETANKHKQREEPQCIVRKSPAHASKSPRRRVSLSSIAFSASCTALSATMPTVEVLSPERRAQSGKGRISLIRWTPSERAYMPIAPGGL